MDSLPIPPNYLVVDPRPSIRYSIRWALEACGCEGLAVSSLKEAFDDHASPGPDLVFASVQPLGELTQEGFEQFRGMLPRAAFFLLVGAEAHKAWKDQDPLCEPLQLPIFKQRVDRACRKLGKRPLFYREGHYSIATLLAERAHPLGTRLDTAFRLIHERRYDDALDFSEFLLHEFEHIPEAVGVGHYGLAAVMHARHRDAMNREICNKLLEHCESGLRWAPGLAPLRRFYGQMLVLMATLQDSESSASAPTQSGRRFFDALELVQLSIEHLTAAKRLDETMAEGVDREVKKLEPILRDLEIKCGLSRDLN